MDHTPLDAATLTDEAVLSEDARPGASFPHRPRHEPETLRYRGVVMNALSGAVLAHGRPVRLAVRERELLATLMSRAGQIVTPTWLATQMHIPATDIDALASGLISALRDAGVTCLPRHVEGIGYVLWR
ncbi:MAG: winged helix-turn-helix domain-containing protein [Chloroflexota bacterium]|nr:winged helix-turn-helix domain-containing protein [Chloroflexota bacterium]